MIAAAMTDTSFWGWTIVACLAIAFTLALFAAGLAKSAGRPAPKPPTAEAIVRAEYEAAS